MIYFIKSPNGPIKIGTTIHLSQRLKQLAAEYGEGLEVLAVAEGSYDAEKALHGRFAHLRTVGEWFEPGDDLTGFIVAEGRQWDGSDDSPVSHQIRIDSDLATKAKYLAAKEGLALAEYLSAILRPVVTRDFRKAAPKVGGDS